MPDYLIQVTPACGSTLYSRDSATWTQTPTIVNSLFSATGCQGSPFTEAYIPWSALSGAQDGTPALAALTGPPFGLYSYVYDPYSHDSSDVMPLSYTSSS